MRLETGDIEGIDKKLEGTMMEAAELCLRGEGIDPGAIEISLSFVTPEEIRALNRDYRGVDRVTDVLSFPMVEDLEELPGLEEPKESPITHLLGDVVICLDRAAEQAEEYGHSRQREIVYLFVHSVLHLLGYDHMEPEEKREMRQREEAVMEQLNLRRD